MKRILALALALSSTAAMAAAGDAWYGTNRDREYVTIPIEQVVRTTPDTIVIYEDRALLPSAPVIVERREYVYEPLYAPREIVVLREERDYVDALNPSTDRRLGRGLFPKTGPNDFGS